MTIDPDAITPPYLQLVAILRERIADGTYTPGRRIPSRMELEQEFHLAPGTIVKAVDVLKKEGVLVAVQGRGTFLSEDSKKPQP